MSAFTKPCDGCGGEIAWTDETPEPIAEHCAACPPWICATCGQPDSYTPGEGPQCSCWVSLAELTHADIKAIFAADGTFNVETSGALSFANPASPSTRQENDRD